MFNLYCQAGCRDMLQWQLIIQHGEPAQGTPDSFQDSGLTFPPSWLSPSLCAVRFGVPAVLISSSWSLRNKLKWLFSQKAGELLMHYEQAPEQVPCCGGDVLLYGTNAQKGASKLGCKRCMWRQGAYSETSPKPSSRHICSRPQPEHWMSRANIWTQIPDLRSQLEPYLPQFSQL